MISNSQRYSMLIDRWVMHKNWKKIPHKVVSVAIESQILEVVSPITDQKAYWSLCNVYDPKIVYFDSIKQAIIYLKASRESKDINKTIDSVQVAIKLLFRSVT